MWTSMTNFFFIFRIIFLCFFSTLNWLRSAQIYVAEHFMDVRDNENNLNLLKNVSLSCSFLFLVLFLVCCCWWPLLSKKKKHFSNFRTSSDSSHLKQKSGHTWFSDNFKLIRPQSFFTAPHSNLTIEIFISISYEIKSTDDNSSKEKSRGLILWIIHTMNFLWPFFPVSSRCNILIGSSFPVLSKLLPDAG